MSLQMLSVLQDLIQAQEQLERQARDRVAETYDCPENEYNYVATMGVRVVLEHLRQIVKKESERLAASGVNMWTLRDGKVLPYATSLDFGKRLLMQTWQTKWVLDIQKVVGRVWTFSTLVNGQSVFVPMHEAPGVTVLGQDDSSYLVAVDKDKYYLAKLSESGTTPAWYVHIGSCFPHMPGSVCTWW